MSNFNNKTALISTNSDQHTKQIWNFLMQKIKNPYGVAGLMGNLYAESSMCSNNLQNSFESKSGFTNDTYTKAVDENSYTNFIYDKAGYGLAQWTHWSCKKKLLEYAKENNCSIADYEMQLNFLYEDLEKNYKLVLSTLKTAESILEASNSFLFKYERPANQGSSVQKKRESYGQKYFNKFANPQNIKNQLNKNNLLQNQIIGYAIAKTAMHVREENKTKSTSWGIVEKGQKVQVLEILDNNWYKIIWANSPEGYGFTSNSSGEYYDFFKKIKEYPVKIKANALNIREGIGIFYRIKGLLKKNTVHTIIEEKDGWGRLKSGAGWIKLSYTEKINNEK